MRETLDLGGTTYSVRAPLVPIRLRLREAFLQAEGVDMLAISGASIAAACPLVLPDLTAADQRRQIRTDLIDFGERAVDVLVGSGAAVEAVLREGSALLIESLDDLPSDEEIEDEVGNTQARAGDSTPSTSVSG
jgi:hypothetical protein